jgi:FkbM family methyltransferase
MNTTVLRNVRERLPQHLLLGSNRRLAEVIETTSRHDLLSLGSTDYGYWVVPSSLLGPESVCYLAGTGTDISFDQALIDRFGCTVHAFDPVPAAAAYVEVAARHEPRFIFHPVGLWSKDMSLSFHAPARTGWVSHSATNIHETGVAFEMPARSVKSLMTELHHDHVDLLKLSVEGSEFEILKSLKRDGVTPTIICVEFAQPAAVDAAVDAYRRLLSSGYSAVAANVTRKTAKLTFVRDGFGPGRESGS